jgi:hypothetical protein
MFTCGELNTASRQPGKIKMISMKVFQVRLRNHRELLRVSLRFKLDVFSSLVNVQTKKSHVSSMNNKQKFCMKFENLSSIELGYVY